MTLYVASLEQSSQRTNARAVATQYLSSLRARIESEMYATLYLSKSLTAYVATHPDLDQAEFARLASEVIAGSRNIRNIGLARDNVISHMYPLSGNETAIGLDYRNVPEQWPAVKRAIGLGSPVLAGPVDLVQGGRGFIARTPIFLNPELYGLNPDGTPRYWGISSLVIDVPGFLDSLQLTGDDSSYRLALRGRDGLGADGGIIYGSESHFSGDVLLQEVLLPNGTWQLAARPVGDWAPDILHLPVFYIGGSSSLLIAVLLGLLVRARLRSRSLALHDHLTHLPNRRLFEDRLQQATASADRNGNGFHLVYVDLNGFKEINDRFGHQSGDQVLYEVAQRLLGCVRRSDTVARIGGDEFVILIHDAGTDRELQTILAKLHAALDPPIFSSGESIRISASIGQAHYPSDSDNGNDLLARADHRMYAEKHAKVTPLFRDR